MYRMAGLCAGIIRITYLRNRFSYTSAKYDRFVNKGYTIPNQSVYPKEQNPTPQNPTFRFPQTGFKRISASSSSSKLNWVGVSI